MVENEEVSKQQVAGSEECIEGNVEEDEPDIRTRSGHAIQRPSRFLGVTKVSRSEWKECACEDSIKVELRQLFHKLNALRVICRAEVTKSAKVLKLQMFLVKKYLVDRLLKKVKVISSRWKRSRLGLVSKEVITIISYSFGVYHLGPSSN